MWKFWLYSHGSPKIFIAKVGHQSLASVNYSHFGYAQYPNAWGWFPLIVPRKEFIFTYKCFPIRLIIIGNVIIVIIILFMESVWSTGGWIKVLEMTFCPHQRAVASLFTQTTFDLNGNRIWRFKFDNVQHLQVRPRLRSHPPPILETVGALEPFWRFV